jgi:hypothetical protein
VRDRKALLQKRGKLIFAKALTPASERGAVEWAFVLKDHLAAEQLKIRVLDPTLAQLLIGEVVHVLEDEEPGNEPRR